MVSLMSKGWTEERRKQQAERIRQTRPWEKATGPKTEAGKDRVSQNALKHGRYTEEYKQKRKNETRMVRMALMHNDMFMSMSRQIIHHRRDEENFEV